MKPAIERSKTGLSQAANVKKNGHSHMGLTRTSCWVYNLLGSGNDVWTLVAVTRLLSHRVHLNRMKYRQRRW